MVFSNKKRFIAGAVCKRCHQQDVIIVFHETKQDWQACVVCGHRQALGSDDSSNEAVTTSPIKPIDSVN